jgi:hypothetical protein
VITPSELESRGCWWEAVAVWTVSHDRGGGIALPRDEFVEKRRSEGVLASQQWKESGEMGGWLTWRGFRAAGSTDGREGSLIKMAESEKAGQRVRRVVSC